MSADHGRRPLTAIAAFASDHARVLILAAVMAATAADTGVVGAVADQLRRSLHIDNTGVGLLAAVPATIGAVMTIPAGWLADHVRRVPLLAASVAVWSAALALGGLAGSFLWLLVSRVGLGMVAALSGPVVASLTGDLFPAGERAAAYGRILAGELVGSGLGLLAGGDIAAVLDWRAAFWFLAGLGAPLAVITYRWLPEPPRGQGPASDSGDRTGRTDRAAVRPRTKPRAGAVLTEDPSRMGWWGVLRYVLRIRTNVVIIIASTIGYFFFAGLRTFGFLFAQQHFGVSKLELSLFVPILGIGAIAGVLGGGRLADRSLHRGRIAARVTIPGAAYLLAVAAFVPGLLIGGIGVALPLFTLGAAGLAAANPPLDAARLDVVHHLLWGRAESIRTLLRLGGEASGPVVFGWLSRFFGQGTADLTDTFLIGLAALAVNGALLYSTRRAYPADVAAALASERATASAQSPRAPNPA